VAAATALQSVSRLVSLDSSLNHRLTLHFPILKIRRAKELATDSPGAGARDS
jgi:hypothetical protein